MAGRWNPGRGSPRPHKGEQQCHAWQGKQGSPLENMKNAICSKENLMLAYRSAIKGKRYRQEVLIFKENLEQNLDELRNELLKQTYRVGDYREFYVTIPKLRLVMALHFRDRIVQWALYRQLNPYLDKRYIFDSYGCREGKGTLAAADRVLYWFQMIRRKPDYENWYYLKLDISKFFYRVDHGIMMDMVREISDDPWFVDLMDTIINNPDVPFGLPEGMKAHDCPKEERLFDVGMPIGNLSSQMMANLYLDPLDQYCKHVLHIEFYARYMDDIIILGNDLGMLHEYMRLIGQFLQERLKLKLNSKSAIRRVASGVEFVGYYITPSGKRMRKSTAKRIKRVLRHFAKEYAAGRMDLDDIMPTMQSYFGMMKHCESYHLRRWITENISFKRASSNIDDLPELRLLEDDEWYKHVEMPQEDDWYVCYA